MKILIIGTWGNGMQKNVFLISLICFALMSPCLVFAKVIINGVEISDDGKIIYLDKTEQGTATAKGDTGPQGPQGPKGDEGPQGQVNKDALCQIYSTEGVSLPAFCSKKVIFLTSQQFDGNLGGLAGADAKCQTAATAGGLSGTFKAWMSDTTISARDRLTHNPAPYIRTDGATIANNWADLTDYHIKEPIMCDEFKECSAYVEMFHNDTWRVSTWTGTWANGSAYPNPVMFCDNWSAGDGSKQGSYGLASSIDEHWTDNSPMGCQNILRLYCIEQ